MDKNTTLTDALNKRTKTRNYNYSVWFFINVFFMASCMERDYESHGKTSQNTVI